MAAATKITSAWVSSYSDKTDEWVRARLEYLDNLERISRTGSIPRRRDIRKLRVELLERKKAAVAAVEALNGVPVPALNGAATVVTAAVLAPPIQQVAQAQRAGR